MNYLTSEMKEQIRKLREIALINEKIKGKNSSREIYRTATKQAKYILPEEFTGKDMKRFKKLKRS